MDERRARSTVCQMYTLDFPDSACASTLRFSDSVRWICYLSAFSSFCGALSLQEENTRIFQSEIESRIVTVLRASLPGFFCTLLRQEIQENVIDGHR